MWNHKLAIGLTSVVIFSFMLTPGLARANEGTGGMEMQVNGYHVQLIFTGPAKVGENQVDVQITGPDGSPVSGAQVEVAVQAIEETETHAADMESAHVHAPAPTSIHDGMSGMDAATPTPADVDSHDMAGMDDQAAQPAAVLLQTGHHAGQYTGTITFPQAGHWMLTVHFMTNGEMLETEFPLDVASDFPISYGVLSSFFGLNVAIVVAAAIAKRKTIHA